MKSAADIEDQQHQEDLQSNVCKLLVASFRPPPTAAKDVEDEIGSADSENSALCMSIWWFLRNITHNCWFLGPVRATRSEKILPDGMESDDSDKDQYRPEDQGSSDEDDAESKNEVESEDVVDSNESEKEEVLSKKGKNVKPGRCEIAAIQTSVPTTGSKSALEHSKLRERSPGSVP